MVKRQKWTKIQDLQLKKLMKDSKPVEEIDWHQVSKIMKKSKIYKSPKQCRERWNNQLDPVLKKQKWNDKDNRYLFILFEKKGNKWKEIAENFDGRTDNCIKNQFFSLIRKSLRNS